MSDPNQPTIPAGWYPDGHGGQRWWDGTGWTEHTQPPAAGPAADATVVAPRQPAPPQQPPVQSPVQPPVQPQFQQPYGQPQQFAQPAWTPPPGSGGGKRLGLILGGAAAAVVVLLLIVVILVKALGGGGPGDVAQEYLLASFDGDVEKVCELSSEDQRDDLLEAADADDCGEYGENRKQEEEDQRSEFEDEYGHSVDEIRENYDVEFEVKDVDEDGDKATVEIRQTAEYTADDDFLEEELDGDRSSSRTLTMKLVKEDGDWKVSEPYSG